MLTPLAGFSYVRPAGHLRWTLRSYRVGEQEVGNSHSTNERFNTGDSVLSVHASLATGNKLANSWIGDVDLKFIRDQVGTPVSLYSERQLRRNVERITAAAAAAGHNSANPFHVR